MKEKEVSNSKMEQVSSEEGPVKEPPSTEVSAVKDVL